MTNMNIKSKAKTKKTEERPQFEADYLKDLRGVAARLNDLPDLKKHGLAFEIAFEATPKETTEEGTNWGWSYYDHWGTMTMRLAKSDQYVDLASYRALYVDGHKRLTTKATRANAGYGALNFSDTKDFSKFADQVTKSAIAAITEDFKLPLNKRLESGIEKLRQTLITEHEQKIIVKKAAEDMQRAFQTMERSIPNMTLKQIITGPLADFAFGPKAPWSNMERRFVDTMPANVGACVMCLYLDGLDPEPWIVVGERPNPNKPGDFLYNGSGGGFGNLLFPKKLHKARVDKAYGEQPRETAVRELGEENRTPDNEPVFDLDPTQLKLIDDGCGIDYGAVAKGGFPTAYIMYYAALNDEQKTAAKSHAAGMEDEAYRKACAAHTGNETSRVRVMRLATAAELPVEQAAYPHEAKAFRTLQAMYTAGKLAL